MVTVPLEETDLPLGLAARFRDDADRMLAQIADAIIDEFPHLADEALLPEGLVHHTLAGHAGTFVQLLENRKAVAPPEVSEFGRALARAGEPFTTLTRAFEIGHEALWQELATMVMRCPELRTRELELMRGLTVRLFEYMHVNTAAAVRSYVHREGEDTKAADRRRLAYVRKGLRGEVDDHELEVALGHRLLCQHIAFAVHGPAVASEDVAALLQQIRRRVQPVQFLSIWDGDLLVGWFTPRDATWRQRLDELDVPDAVTVACGALRHGPDGFRQSHCDALDVVRVVDVLTATGIHHYDDAAVLALATHDLSAAAAFVDSQLGPLASPTEQTQHLLDTLRVYLAENGSPTRAGRRLHTHRNTVLQRLERIESHIGRSVAPGDLSLQLAVEVVTLTSHLSEPSGR